jgi:hypothetical protein
MPIHGADHIVENAIAIASELVDDRRLSPGACGLAIRLCSQQQRHGKDWLVPGPADAPRLPSESANRMRAYFGELVAAGYLIQEVPGAYTLKPGLWRRPSELDDESPLR